MKVANDPKTVLVYWELIAYDHLVESGLATNWKIQMTQLDDLIKNQHQIPWFPFMWAQNLLRKARKEGLVADDWIQRN